MHLDNFEHPFIWGIFVFKKFWESYENIVEKNAIDKDCYHENGHYFHKKYDKLIFNVSIYLLLLSLFSMVF